MSSQTKKYRVKLVGWSEYARQKLAEAWVEAVIEKAEQSSPTQE